MEVEVEEEVVEVVEVVEVEVAVRWRWIWRPRHFFMNLGLSHCSGFVLVHIAHPYFTSSARARRAASVTARRRAGRCGRPRRTAAIGVLLRVALRRRLLERGHPERERKKEH